MAGSRRPSFVARHPQYSAHASWAEAESPGGRAPCTALGEGEGSAALLPSASRHEKS